MTDISNIYGQEKQKKWRYAQTINPNLPAGEHAGHGQGELWLYSYADLVTNLLLFFVMMFAISSVDSNKFNALSAAIHGDTQKLQEISKEENSAQVKAVASQIHDIDKTTGTEKNQQVMQLIQLILGKLDLDALENDEIARKLMEELKKRLELIAKINPEKDAPTAFDILMPSDKYFEKGQTVLTPQATRFVQKLSLELKAVKFPFHIAVEGHSDSTEVGKAGKTRWELSSQRAGAVIDVLTANGLKAGSISIAGYADTMPIYPEKDVKGNYIERNQSLNRRVVIKVVRKGNLLADASKPKEVTQ